jgi:hypothetical protein
MSLSSFIVFMHIYLNIKVQINHIFSENLLSCSLQLVIEKSFI